MKRPQSLTAKLKKCDQEIKLYVIELEKENLKLQEQIAKFQVENVTHQNEIKALKKFQLKPPTVVIRKFGQDNLPPK
jgi:hypothetical protein